jgi:hypothetical protein
MPSQIAKGDLVMKKSICTAALANKNYEKSLELDPANGNAVEMLKKLRGQ